MKLGQSLSEFSLWEVDIFAVGSWGKYTEPAVVIEGDPKYLDKVYLLEEKFHQSRFVVNDLYKKTCYLVETKWCRNPDKV